MKRDPNQLSFFDNEEVEEIVPETKVKSNLEAFASKKPLQRYHIYAVDKFDNKREDDIEAVSWKQAMFLFKRKHGFYWECHR
jgi:hypothetical protein